MNPALENTSAYQLIFTRPEVFMYLLLLIPVAAVLALHFRRRFPVIAAFLAASPSEAAPRPATRLALRYLFSSLCFLLFLASMISALAGPVMGSRLVREFRRGCDVVLAFDISRSMLVKDCVPPQGEGSGDWSRLDQARWIAQNLVMMGGDKALIAGLAQNSGGGTVFIRYAAAFGKGRSILALPVTSDTQSVLTLLDALSVDMITSRGTNLERLIDTAAEAFLDNTPAGRQIVLFSDGESLAGSLTQAVERAKLKDITVFAVGVGSPSGALVPDGTGGMGGAQLVRSFLHTDLLQTAVERRGGAYIDGNSAGAVKQLAEKILPYAGEASWVFREESGAQWHLFVILGIVFLGISVLCTLRVKHK